MTLALLIYALISYIYMGYYLYKRSDEIEDFEDLIIIRFLFIISPLSLILKLALTLTNLYDERNRTN